MELNEHMTEAALPSFRQLSNVGRYDSHMLREVMFALKRTRSTTQLFGGVPPAKFSRSSFCTRANPR